MFDTSKILIIFILFTTISFSNADDCNSSMSNAEYTTCLFGKNASLEEELKTIYQDYLVKHKNDPTHQAKIKASQAMWKKYKETEIDMAFPYLNVPKYNWTGLSACYFQYNISLMKQRIILLQMLDKVLEKSGCTTHVSATQEKE